MEGREEAVREGQRRTFSDFLASRTFSNAAPPAFRHEASRTPVLGTGLKACAEEGPFGDAASQRHFPAQPRHQLHRPRPSGLHRHGERQGGFGKFVWLDHRVFRQRQWLMSLPREHRQHPSGLDDAASPRAAPALAKAAAPRPAKRLSAGLTLRAIGEQTILHHTSKSQLSSPASPAKTASASFRRSLLATSGGVDVKAWPTFGHYKAACAQLSAQRTKLKMGLQPGEARPALVLRGGHAGSRPQQLMILAPGAPSRLQRAPPTFASITGNGTGGRPSPQLRRSSSSTAAPFKPSKDPSLALHLIRLAVIDGQQAKACLILTSCFGIPLDPAIAASAWPGTLPNVRFKADLLAKPKFWPAILRIWLRALDRGMDSLLLMLYAAGIPRYPQGPISFLPPKKPPSPPSAAASSTYPATMVSAAASSIISVTSTVTGWLEKTFQAWIRDRFPSYFLAAVAFGRERLVRTMLAQRKVGSSLISSQWLGITPLLVAAATTIHGRSLALVTTDLLDSGANPLDGICYYTFLKIHSKLMRHARYRPHHHHHRRHHSSSNAGSQRDSQQPAAPRKPHNKARLSKVLRRCLPTRHEATLWARSRSLLPVEVAAANLNFELVLLLLGRSSQPTPYLLGLLFQDDLDICIRLIKAGAVVGQTDPFENSPIHWAAAKGRADLVAVFLHYGASVDSVNLNKCTPLHQAAYYGHRQVVRYLIQAGADCSILNSDGLTALQVARRHGMASEDLLDYFTTSIESDKKDCSLGPGSSSQREVTDRMFMESLEALITQVEAFTLADDQVAGLPKLSLNEAGIAPKRRGRFLIEKIINLPRHWLSSDPSPSQHRSPQM